MMKLYFILLLILINVGIISISYSQDLVLLKNVDILDLKKGVVRKNFDVLINKKKIVDIGHNIREKSSYRVIPLPNRIIMPGMVDMHAHLYVQETLDKIEYQKSFLPLFLSKGITAIFSPGESNIDSLFSIQKKVDLGDLIGPEIWTSGPYLDGNPSKIHWIDGIKSLSEIDDFFTKYGDKIDAIKVYSSITLNDLKKVIILAEVYNLKVTAHLESISLKEAIRLGINGVEHGLLGVPELIKEGAFETGKYCDENYVMEEDKDVLEIIDLMVKHNIYTSTTLTPNYILRDNFQDFNVTKKIVNKNIYNRYKYYLKTVRENLSFQSCVRELTKNQLVFLKMFKDRGGRIVIGTDPINPFITPGYSYHLEMFLLKEAGFKELEILRMAIINPVNILSKDKIGAIKVGYEANLIILKENPLSDIKNIKSIEFVIKSGKVFSQKQLAGQDVGED